MASASPIVASGEMVIGSSIMPASDRLTMSTWWAWSSMDRLRWITPRPPWRAMATAIRASVTVSIGEETSGIFTEIRFDTGVLVSTSDGMMSLWLGCSSTSSKVRPNVANGCGTPAGVRSPMVCDTCSLSCRTDRRVRVRTRLPVQDYPGGAVRTYLIDRWPRRDRRVRRPTAGRWVTGRGSAATSGPRRGDPSTGRDSLAASGPDRRLPFSRSAAPADAAAARSAAGGPGKPRSSPSRLRRLLD